MLGAYSAEAQQEARAKEGVKLIGGNAIAYWQPGDYEHLDATGGVVSFRLEGLRRRHRDRWQLSIPAGVTRVRMCCPLCLQGACFGSHHCEVR